MVTATKIKDNLMEAQRILSSLKPAFSEEELQIVKAVRVLLKTKEGELDALTKEMVS